MSLPNFRTLVVGTIVAVGLGSFMVWAHGGDTSLVHACVHQKTQAVRIVGANQNCQNNELPQHWSIQGPTGPAGPAGPGGSLRVVDLNGVDLGARVTEAQFFSADATVFLESVGVLARLSSNNSGQVLLSAQDSVLLWDQPNCSGTPYVFDDYAHQLHADFPSPFQYWRATQGVAASQVTLASIGDRANCTNQIVTEYVVPAENVTNLLSFSAAGDPVVGDGPFRIVVQ